MIQKPDKLSDEEFWELYKDIADDVLSTDGWEVGDIIFILVGATIIILIWELGQYLWTLI